MRKKLKQKGNQIQIKFFLLRSGSDSDPTAHTYLDSNAGPESTHPHQIWILHQIRI